MYNIHRLLYLIILIYLTNQPVKAISHELEDSKQNKPDDILPLEPDVSLTKRDTSHYFHPQIRADDSSISGFKYSSLGKRTELNDQLSEEYQDSSATSLDTEYSKRSHGFQSRDIDETPGYIHAPTEKRADSNFKYSTLGKRDSGIDNPEEFGNHGESLENQDDGYEGKRGRMGGMKYSGIGKRSFKYASLGKRMGSGFKFSALGKKDEDDFMQTNNDDMKKRSSASFKYVGMGKKADELTQEDETDKRAGSGYRYAGVGKRAGSGYRYAGVGKRAGSGYRYAGVGKRAASGYRYAGVGKRASGGFRYAGVGKRAGEGFRYAGVGKRASGGFRYAGVGKRASGGFRYAGVGKRAGGGFRYAGVGKRASGGFRYAGVGKRAGGGFRYAGVGKRAGGGFRYAGVGKRAGGGFKYAGVGKRTNSEYSNLDNIDSKSYLYRQLNHKADGDKFHLVNKRATGEDIGTLAKRLGYAYRYPSVGKRDQDGYQVSVRYPTNNYPRRASSYKFQGIGKRDDNNVERRQDTWRYAGIGKRSNDLDKMLEYINVLEKGPVYFDNTLTDEHYDDMQW